MSCSAGTLAPGDTRTYTITATVNSGVPSGTVIPNCAVVYTGTSPETNWDNNQSCTNTTVQPSPKPPSSDVEVSKTGPATVEAGGTVSYSVTVTNHGPDPATNAVVSDPIDVPFDSVSALPADCALEDTSVTCRPATLAVNEGRTYSYSVKIRSAVAVGTNISNCATVTSVNNAIVQVPNPSCVGTVVVPVPMSEVQVVKTATSDAAPGGTVGYRLTVTNDGPDEAAGVVISDPVDPSVVTVTSVPSGCSVTSGTVTCAAGTLAAGETRVYDITATVNADVAAGTVIRNCASVSSSTSNPDPLGTTSCADTYVDPPVPVADVSVAKTAPVTAHAGDTFDYAVSATNHGPDDATDLVVTDPVPADLVAVTALPPGCTLSGGTVNCTAGSLAVGDTKSFTFTVRADAALAAGTDIDNCAHAASVTTILSPLEQPSCTQTTIVSPAVADLVPVKTAPASVAPGDTFSYTLTATDDGPDDAVGSVVSDHFDQLLVTITSVPACCTQSGGLVTCDAWHARAGREQGLHDHGQGEPAHRRVVIDNCAYDGSTTFDPFESNNQACAGTQVGITGPTANVVVAKSGPVAVTAGGTASYVLAVTNHGPGLAHDVAVTDVLPGDFSAVTALPRDCIEQGTVISCATGTLAVGKSRSFTFTARVNSGEPAGTEITNCASVSSVATALAVLEGRADCAQSLVVPSRAALVSITKTAAQRVAPGGTLSYTLIASDDGPDAAQDVTVRDPIQQSLVTVVSLPGGCTLAGGTINCVIGTLAAARRIRCASWSGSAVPPRAR